MLMRLTASCTQHPNSKFIRREISVCHAFDGNCFVDKRCAKEKYYHDNGNPKCSNLLRNPDLVAVAQEKPILTCHGRSFSRSCSRYFRTYLRLPPTVTQQGAVLTCGVSISNKGSHASSRTVRTAKPRI